MIKRMLIMVALLALVFGGIFGWKAFEDYQQAQYLAQARPPAVVVSSTTVAQDAWQVRISSVGSLSAIQGVEVSAEVPGTVAAISFESGHQIEAGGLLVALDATAERAELRSLQAQLELARLDYRRSQGLLKSTALSQAQLDRAKSVLDSMRAQVEEQAAFIAKKSVRAPFSGELGIRKVNLGQYLSAGSEIVTLQSLDPIYANFTLPERFLQLLAVGQSIEVEVAAFPDRSFLGNVTAISPKVEETTRNVTLQATLQNGEHLLRPGMFTRVFVLAGGIDDVLTVPRTAITFYPYGDSVFVIRPAEGDPDDLIVERRQVATGRIRDGRVEITSGLEPGEQIVNTGQLKLRAHQHITIDNSIELPIEVFKR